MQPEFRHLAIASLTFSQTTAQKERRAHFNKDAMTELAGSIAIHGIAQPILVRPRFKEDHGEINQFEVCAGERRVLAAKQAGLTEVPAMVREISDEQLLELQLIENLQREGLHELAEAEGYEQLMQKYGLDIDQIIAKVGKSRSYVYGRLKLTALCKDARAAFYEGKLSASTALDLARIPVDALQKQALKEILKPRYAGEALSVRAAREHIQDNYMLRLAAAGFETDDPTLVPKAGACGACPKRTGNQPELFGDVKGADVCTDPICFKAKIAAHGQRAIENAKATGQRVLTGEAAVKKIAPYGITNSLQDYVRLDAKSYDHDGKTHAELLGKDYVPILLQDPDTGALIKIAPRKDIPKPKRAVGGATRTASNGPSAAAEKAKRDLEISYRTELRRQLFKKAPATPNLPMLIRICALAAEDMSDVEVREVLTDAGLEKKASGVLWEQKFAKLSTTELARVGYVLMLMGETPSDGYGKAHELEAAAKLLKIDAKKVRADVVAKAKSQAAPSTKAAAGKKTAPQKAPRKK